jgi:hypothetical protein
VGYWDVRSGWRRKKSLERDCQSGASIGYLTADGGGTA